MSKPLIAIVGRPNVGKSMLFNKIIGRRLSIVEDTPGVTRDRIYGESDWNGRKFRLVDTGGIEPNTDNQILAFMREQAQIAIDNANVIIFVTDIKTGMTAADQEVAGMLQRSKKPIVLAVNKMDSTGAVDPDFYEFYNLGLGDPIAVSAVHGHGTGDLLDACLQYFPPEDEEEEDSDVIQVAIIGKPNVGKSSLTNRILGQQRVIVSNVAGTTRDAIDSYFENETGKYNFIDTAGMRKKSKVDDNIEKYSVLRATMAIERSDVCLIMIDAQDGVTEQDTKVAGLAHEAGKACIIVVNKWDLVEKDDKTMDRMREDIRRDLSYMTYAPIVFISALTGQRVTRLFELINYVREQSSMRITTGMLNSVLADAQTRVQPPTDKGRHLVRKYCFRLGLYWQGLTHDLSKYSPTEFWRSAKYYQGYRSPNDQERLVNGVSLSWLHHKGRNRHHFEYWIDYCRGEDGTPFIGGCKMPVKYVAEMFCDRIAACRVYQKEKYTDASPYDYFQHSKGHLCRSEHGHGFIHPETSELLTRWLLLLKEQGEDAAFLQIRQELKELRRA